MDPQPHPTRPPGSTATRCLHLMATNGQQRQQIEQLQDALGQIERMSMGTTVGRIARAALLATAVTLAACGGGGCDEAQAAATPTAEECRKDGGPVDCKANPEQCI